MDRLLSVDEVAKIVGCCRTTAYNMMRKMPHFRPPGDGARTLIRVWERDLCEFLQRNTVDPTPQQRGRKAARPAPVLVMDGFEPDGRLKRRRA